MAQILNVCSTASTTHASQLHGDFTTKELHTDSLAWQWNDLLLICGLTLAEGCTGRETGVPPSGRTRWNTNSLQTRSSATVEEQQRAVLVNSCYVSWGVGVKKAKV